MTEVPLSRGTITRSVDRWWTTCAECSWQAGWFDLEYQAHEALERHIVKAHGASSEKEGV